MTDIYTHAPSQHVPAAPDPRQPAAINVLRTTVGEAGDGTWLSGEPCSCPVPGQARWFLRHTVRLPSSPCEDRAHTGGSAHPCPVLPWGHSSIHKHHYIVLLRVCATM